MLRIAVWSSLPNLSGRSVRFQPFCSPTPIAGLFGQTHPGIKQRDRFSCFCCLLLAPLWHLPLRGLHRLIGPPSLGPSGTSLVALSPIANLARPAPVPSWPVQPCSRSSTLLLESSVGARRGFRFVEESSCYPKIQTDGDCDHNPKLGRCAHTKVVSASACPSQSGGPQHDEPIPRWIFH